MGARQSNINLKPFASAWSERRRLFYIVAMTALVVAAISVTLRAQDWPPDFPAFVNAVIPTPQYLPAGYELWRINRMPAEGFGAGKTEIEVQYRDPGCWARTINCSRQVFVSPAMEKTFSGTMGRTPENLSLRIGSRTVEGQYFNRIESDSTPGGRIILHGDEAPLDPGDFNALVFPFDRFVVAICGNRTAGLGRAELIRVAKSLTYTAR